MLICFTAIGVINDFFFQIKYELLSPIATSTLATVAALSMISCYPFTLQFAIPKVSSETAASKGFLLANQVMTGYWVAIFFLCTASAWSGRIIRVIRGYFCPYIKHHNTHNIHNLYIYIYIVKLGYLLFPANLNTSGNRRLILLHGILDLVLPISLPIFGVLLTPYLVRAIQETAAQRSHQVFVCFMPIYLD